MEVSSVPTEDGSIAEMNTQHDNAMQEDPEWDYDSIITKLRDTECSLLLERFFDSNTLLHVAASLGHDQIVEAILSKQQCQQELLTATNSTGDLPLHVAANAGHLSVVQHLVESHPCQELLMVKNSNGDLPLHVAANAGHLSIVQHLIESSDSSHQCQQELLTARNSSGHHPLHVAANAGHLYVVEHLLNSSHQAQNSKVNVASKLLTGKNNEGNTPLHLALIKKYEHVDKKLKSKYNEVAKLLIETDPIVFNYRNEAQKYPYSMAIEAEDKELLKLMKHKKWKHKFDLAPPELVPVSDDAYCDAELENQSRDSGTGKTLKGVRHNRKSKDKDTSMEGELYETVKLQNITHPKDILDTVLKSLPDDILKEKDDKGMTPLFYAASIGYLDGVELLLKKPTKCCAYERDTDGYYPIHIASRKGHIQVIKKFLDKYPDMIELLNEEGQNILHVAAMYGKAKVVAHMLKGHYLKVEMLINNEDENGNTPLHLAAMKGHPMVVSILTWDKRVDIKALNKEGKRALDLALNYSGENPSFRERLTWEALRYVSSPRAPPRHISGENPQSSKVGKTLSTDKYKDRTDTLLLVATLVATVTFAAAFTMPGGYKDSGGMAKFLEKPMFHVFVISNSIAMYSAITAVVALIWAHLGDLNLFIAAYKFSVPILGLAITMVSLAFMAGNYLVLRDLNWLAYLVLSIGSFFLFTLSIIFFPLCLPNSSPHPIIRYILRYPFYLLIKFTGCDTGDREEE